MSTEHPQVSPGAQIEGFTVGAMVRARSGAATYEATAADGGEAAATIEKTRAARRRRDV